MDSIWEARGARCSTKRGAEDFPGLGNGGLQVLCGALSLPMNHPARAAVRGPSGGAARRLGRFRLCVTRRNWKTRSVSSRSPLRDAPAISFPVRSCARKSHEVCEPLLLAPVKILFLTPGTGSYHCGVCMRDNALAKELRALGHDAVLLPLYLPLTLDESAASPGAPVFFGGLNVYLQQRFPWFRKAPSWLDPLLDHPWLLGWLGRFSGMTQGAEIGALTLSMLRGEEGAQVREVEKLAEWVQTVERPDIVWLSTGLLAGVARRIQAGLRIPVLCSLQGEDSFLDGLPEPWRSECWREMGMRIGECAGCVAPSAYFADAMERRLNVNSGFIEVIPNGIGLEGMAPPDGPRPGKGPTIGFLSRLSAGKGLGTVVDAFLELRARGRHPEARLICTGTMNQGDEPFLGVQRRKLAAAGLGESSEFRIRVTREEKIQFLRELDVLSVPASYGEAFGLYLLEAMACGVPVVQPRTAAFPEIIDSTGGGLLYDENGGASALADAWEQLFSSPENMRLLGKTGRDGVLRAHSMGHMASKFLAYAERVCFSENQPSGS